MRYETPSIKVEKFETMSLIMKITPGGIADLDDPNFDNNPSNF